jgi:1,4-alpha-glucan branching enzyme
VTRLWQELGSHVRNVDGVDGVTFAVWAPNARSVSVVGDFNDWDGGRNPMQRDDDVWRLFVAGARAGARYKYEIRGARGELLPLKSDPLARYAEARPGNASIVWEAAPARWRDEEWMRERAARNRSDAPISIYEVHVGSWRHGAEGRSLSYNEIADQLLPYACEMGFTHVELLPLAEHPFEGSWGYQPTGMFAPTSRYGTPDDLRAFVERAHERKLGVVFDWVPGHFPNDPHGLWNFDGTPLYEHADPQRGFAPEWSTLVYDYGRREVADFLIASALYWIEEFHVDGLRVDAVASMLYLDYGRAPGTWSPNVHGGNENLEAIAFLRELNTTIAARHPGVATFAEESTIRPKVTAPVAAGGLGFAYKWNMGWMQDTLAYFTSDFAIRPRRWQKLNGTAEYAHGEKYVLPLSHDEVVHGKRSLLRKMPGDRREQFANLRVLLALVYTQPGKKLLFMGAELGDAREWDHETEIGWGLLDDELHAGVQTLVRDCNALYRSSPALHRLDAAPPGFRWIDAGDGARGLLAFARSADERGAEHVIAAFNVLPVAAEYRVGAVRAGSYRIAIDTDWDRYGGTRDAGAASVTTAGVPAHGYPQSLSLKLPPLSAIVLVSP